MGGERWRELLGALTVEEKAGLVAGTGIWDAGGVERLGIGALKLSDGPAGARGSGLLGAGTPTACLPCGASLGATWDPDLLEELGTLSGDEAAAKGIHVLLAPTVNLPRSPYGGRNFECYSEDPLLSGRLAAAFVRGVQSRGVAAVVKHFAANDSEHERHTIDVRADERTLRETVLPPFKAAVVDGGVWGVMGAYNQLNGTHCCEHEWLLGTVLRDEWGFDGFVVSDWFATRSTVGSACTGMSFEMPGPPAFYGVPLAEAVEAGDLDVAALDRIVGDVLRLRERVSALDGPSSAMSLADEAELDRPEDRALLRRAAAAGTVLLRNDGVLPLELSGVQSLAVIGPNADRACVMGGGSAQVNPYRSATLLEALRARLAGRVGLRYEPGCDISRTTPPLGWPDLADEATVAYFDGHGCRGEPAAVAAASSFEMVAVGEPHAGVDASEYSLRMTATLVPSATGRHELRLMQAGRARVLIDGEVVLDATEGFFGGGEAYLGLLSAEIPGPVDLVAGEAVEVAVEFENRDAMFLAGFRLGLLAPEPADLLGAAVEAASACDAAVVVVGTDNEWETEGRDRDAWELPGGQPELIRRVAEANPRTIVVVNAVGPHALDWLEAPAAVLHAGFGGQEFGEALADLILGDAEPGGRMATTVPAHAEQFAAYLNYPGEDGAVNYGERMFVGHRWHDSLSIDPAVPFGFGLSYTTFETGPPRLARTTAAAGEDVAVEVDVANTGDRGGAEVVQIYVEPLQPQVQRPVRELKGFAKVHLDPGEKTTVTVVLDAGAFARYDSCGADFASADDAGWYVDPGDYRISAGRSSRHIVGTAAVTLTGEPQRLAS